ncbi:MAG: helix-turn-helix domain-containing protein [Acidobacteria bacterium]|nr:helix-turn-helix domain-containing protein [Acidobacteriota bacterium]
MWAAIALKRGYSKLYHSIVDDVFPQLTADEQAVYTHLYRLSWGFNNPGVIVSLPKLAERAGMSRNSAARAIARLVGRGLVTKGEPFFGKNQEQGREYRLPIPSGLTSGGSLPVESSPPNVGRNKERLKENVKKGGSASLPEEEKANCPDCQGQGYYYPGGFNEGVKICRHENLRRAGK